ncbi:MAG: VOC family protein [Balneolales bacterium]
MQKITPHLWFDNQAKDAAEFYVSVFRNSSTIKDVTTLHDTPSGDCDVVSFELSEGGRVLMELGEYPFSRRYGWTEDRYGLSWQIVPRAMDGIRRDSQNVRCSTFKRAE